MADGMDQPEIHHSGASSAGGLGAKLRKVPTWVWAILAALVVVILYKIVQANASGGGGTSGAAGAAQSAQDVANLQTTTQQAISAQGAALAGQEQEDVAGLTAGISGNTSQITALQTQVGGISALTTASQQQGSLLQALEDQVTSLSGQLAANHNTNNGSGVATAARPSSWNDVSRILQGLSVDYNPQKVFTRSEVRASTGYKNAADNGFGTFGGVDPTTSAIAPNN